MSKNSSINGNLDPYLRTELWIDEKHPKFIGHFWNSDLYTQKAKDRLNAWIEELRRGFKKHK